MNANRVKVFHGADGYNVALAVADNLKFNFLPAAYALFDKHLRNWGQAQSVCGNIPKLVLVVSDTSACAAQGKRRTDNNRIAYHLGKIHRVVNSLNHL